MNTFNRWGGKQNAIFSTEWLFKGEIYWNSGCEQAPSVVVHGTAQAAIVQGTLPSHEQGPVLTAGSSEEHPTHEGAHSLHPGSAHTSLPKLTTPSH